MSLYETIFGTPYSGADGYADSPNEGGLLNGAKTWMQDPRNAAGLMEFGRALAQAGAPRRGPSAGWGGGLSDALAGFSGGQEKFDQKKMAKMLQDLQMQKAQQDLNQKVDPLSYLSKIDVEKFTPDSMAQFLATKNPSKLVARSKVEVAPNGLTYDPLNTPTGTNLGGVTLHNFGGQTGAVDKMGNILGTMQNTQSPDSAASNATTMRGQNMTNSLGWANNAVAKENQNMPQIIPGANGELISVDRRAGLGSPVMGEDGKPLSKGEKPLTESQGQASMYLGMMKEASKVHEKLKDVNQMQTEWAKGTVPFVPAMVANAAAGSTAQKNAQAQLQWTEAMLRITTGATAPKEEVVRTATTFFPKIGDSPEVVKQKAAQRANMEKYVAIKAGHSGTNQVNSIAGSTPTNTGIPDDIQALLNKHGG